MLKKKGQLTIFIIIGILILFAFALFFYLRGVEVEKKLEIARPVIEKVPSELNPIVLYTEDCLKTVAEHALIKLGQHGGYLYPDQHGSFDFNNPTDSDGIVFSPDSDLRIPYWYYNKASNNENVIKIASMRPELHSRKKSDNSIESQLSRYVNAELKTCLAGYAVFKQQGYEIIEKGDIDTAVTVVPGAVNFLVDYPLDVALGEKSVRRVSKFFTSIALDLDNIYAIADNITNAEAEYAFLEQRTLSLLDVFSDVNTSKLPPMTESTFEFVSTVFWLSKDVEKNIKSMLMSYIPVFRFYQSKNYHEYQYPASNFSDVKQRVYDNMILDFGRPTNLEVRFDYLDWWPVYLVINDNTGIVQPQSASVSFSGFRFGMQRYSTVYDLSYPVLISLTDKSALKGRGYDFNFALETNIRNNRQVHDKESLLAPFVSFEESMLCNLNQRNSANYTIAVKDNYNKTLLDKVMISFSVGDENCVIGTTASNFIGQFPVAYGGIITFMRDHYLTTSQLFDPKPAAQIKKGEDIFEVEMDRLAWINVSVMKKKAVKHNLPGGFPVIKEGTGWGFIPKAFSLEPWEQAVVTLTRISDFDEEYTIGFSVYGDETTQIQLVPGKYKLNIQLLLNEFVRIPEQERDDYTIPEMTFDIFPNGGLNFDSKNLYWDLKANNLYNSNKIIFYAVSPAITDIPENSRVIEDIEQMGMIANYSRDYKDYLQPDFK